VIVVVGRPGLDEMGRLDRPAGRIARAAAASGARVELVGSVADDSDGDATALELGRAGIGHAALLRMPAVGEDDLPRLDAADIELGLNYLTDCRVLVAAEPLEPPALAVVVAAARYHGAALVLTSASGESPPDGLPETATVLEMPDDDEDGGAFADLVGRYAGLLESGRGAAEAWQDAVTETGWQNAPA
jgi:hypothetical protein